MGPGGWSSSKLDLKAKAVEALAIGELAGTGTVAQWAAERAVWHPALRRGEKRPVSRRKGEEPEAIF